MSSLCTGCSVAGTDGQIKSRKKVTADAQGFGRLHMSPYDRHVLTYDGFQVGDFIIEKCV